MSPIKGLTDSPPRLPRIGKIHLGIKVKAKNKKGEDILIPKATEYFVFDPEHPQIKELEATYGKEPKELRILFPVDNDEIVANQYYRYYSQTRGLICKGDGESALQITDMDTGAIPTKESKRVTMVPIPCSGKKCQFYGPRACGETMHLQFLLPEVSGFGVWQIDTGSINSIMNINSNIGKDGLIREVYKRISMVPLLLTLEPKEVINPDDGKKKTVRVLNIRCQDKMLEAYRKASMSPLALVLGVTDREISEEEAETMPIVKVMSPEELQENIDDLWPTDKASSENIDKALAKRKAQEQPPEATEEETEAVEPETGTEPFTTSELLNKVCEVKGFTTQKTARSYLIGKCQIADSRISEEPEAVWDEIKEML